MRYHYGMASPSDGSSCQSTCDNISGCISSKDIPKNAYPICLLILEGQNIHQRVGAAAPIFTKSAYECFIKCRNKFGLFEAIDYEISTSKCNCILSDSYMAVENPDHISASFSWHRFKNKLRNVKQNQNASDTKWGTQEVNRVVKATRYNFIAFLW